MVRSVLGGCASDLQHATLVEFVFLTVKFANFQVAAHPVGSSHTQSLSGDNNDKYFVMYFLLTTGRFVFLPSSLYVLFAFRANLPQCCRCGTAVIVH